MGFPPYIAAAAAALELASTRADCGRNMTRDVAASPRRAEKADCDGMTNGALAMGARSTIVNFAASACRALESTGLRTASTFPPPLLVRMRIGFSDTTADANTGAPLARLRTGGTTRAVGGEENRAGLCVDTSGATAGMPAAAAARGVRYTRRSGDLWLPAVTRLISLANLLDRALSVGATAAAATGTVTVVASRVSCASTACSEDDAFAVVACREEGSGPEPSTARDSDAAAFTLLAGRDRASAPGAAALAPL